MAPQQTAMLLAAISSALTYGETKTAQEFAQLGMVCINQETNPELYKGDPSETWQKISMTAGWTGGISAE